MGTTAPCLSFQHRPPCSAATAFPCQARRHATKPCNLATAGPPPGAFLPRTALDWAPSATPPLAPHGARRHPLPPPRPWRRGAAVGAHLGSGPLPPSPLCLRAPLLTSRTLTRHTLAPPAPPCIPILLPPGACAHRPAAQGRVPDPVMHRFSTLDPRARCSPASPQPFGPFKPILRALPKPQPLPPPLPARPAAHGRAPGRGRRGTTLQKRRRLCPSCGCGTGAVRARPALPVPPSTRVCRGPPTPVTNCSSPSSRRRLRAPDVPVHMPAARPMPSSLQCAGAAAAARGGARSARPPPNRLCFLAP
jgi:hypothetical protein